MKKQMKKIFIYFVIGFFNIHSFCTEVYGAGEETKPDLFITEQLKNAIKKRTSEVAALNKKNNLETSSNNVIIFSFISFMSFSFYK